jgi:hypothetical protein
LERQFVQCPEQNLKRFGQRRTDESFESGSVGEWVPQGNKRVLKTAEYPLTGIRQRPIKIKKQIHALFSSGV